MLAFPGLVYLDMPKTGSTFVRKFLFDWCREPAICRTPHGPPGGDGDAAAATRRSFTFLTLRDPLEIYASLYRYGCGGRGGLALTAAARAHPLAACYDATATGFRRWLDLLLRPGGATLDPYAGHLASPTFGLVTQRLLHLALPGAAGVVSGGPGEGDLHRAYRRGTRVDAVLRMERLPGDLGALIEGALAGHLKAPRRAVAALRAARPLNATASTGLSRDDLTGPLRRRVEVQDRLVYEAMEITRAGSSDGRGAESR